MPIVHTNVIFERLNDEGEKQLQSAINEGKEAFSERFGFNVHWEGLELNFFRCDTRDDPPIDAISAMMTYLAEADKDVVARVIWEDDEYCYFGCAVFSASVSGDSEVVRAPVVYDEHFFDFDTHCLPIIKRDYANAIEEEGLKPDSDEYEDQEAFEEWYSSPEWGLDMWAISEVQHNATDEQIKFLLSHSWQHGKDGWEQKAVKKKATKKKVPKRS